MNAYKKINAYAEAEEAYDYSAEEKVSTSRGSSYAPDTGDSFERAFYYESRNEEQARPSVEEKPISFYLADKKPEPKKAETESEDLRPSATTLQFLDKENNPLEDYRAESEPNVTKKFKINTKAKVFIALYALVILTIFALIILNTALLRSIDNTVSVKQTRIEVLKDENAELRYTLSEVSADDMIAERAAQRGMVRAD